MVSKEDVRTAYRLILGREAESEEVVAAHASAHSSTDELHHAFINSAEFQSRAMGQPVALALPPPALPAVPMYQACRFGIPIRILEPEVVDGNVSLVELIVLNHLVAERSPTVVFELGTFDGRTTINLAANAPEKATIYTIDLPQSQIDKAQFDFEPADRKYIKKEKSGVRFDNTVESAKIVQLLGDTASFDFSKWYGQVDFVFVDASHSAPYVRNDTEVAYKLVGHRPGLIAWHDYNGWPGVTEVLEEYQRDDSRFRNLTYVSGTSIAFCEILG
jgi:predicted O-methyltransferase YrrM